MYLAIYHQCRCHSNLCHCLQCISTYIHINQLAHSVNILSVTQSKLIMYTYNERLGPYYMSSPFSQSSANTHRRHRRIQTHTEAPPDTSRSLTRSLINSPTCARSFSSEVHIAFLTGENCRAIKSSEDEHSSSWY